MASAVIEPLYFCPICLGILTWFEDLGVYVCGECGWGDDGSSGDRAPIPEIEPPTTPTGPEPINA